MVPQPSRASMMSIMSCHHKQITHPPTLSVFCPASISSRLAFVVMGKSIRMSTTPAARGNQPCCASTASREIYCTETPVRSFVQGSGLVLGQRLVRYLVPTHIALLTDGVQVAGSLTSRGQSQRYLVPTDAPISRWSVYPHLRRGSAPAWRDFRRVVQNEFECLQWQSCNFG
jgi:hypothetical protein